MLAYGLPSYLDNSANIIVGIRNHYLGENSPLVLLLNSDIFHSIFISPSFWHYFECIHSIHTELYQFFSMTNYLKRAERDSHTNNTPTIFLHNVYFTLTNLFAYKDFFFQPL